MMEPCASNTAARCPGTTPSSTTGAPCNCCPTELADFRRMQVEVQEDPGGRLLVQYQGQTIPTQEAPPRRPTVLRETAAAPPESSRSGPRHQRRWRPMRRPPRDIANWRGGPGLETPQVQGATAQIPTARQRTLWRMCGRPSPEDSPQDDRP